MFSFYLLQCSQQPLREGLLPFPEVHTEARGGQLASGTGPQMLSAVCVAVTGQVGRRHLWF